MCVIFGFSDTVAGTTEKGAGDSRRSGILFASSINKNNGVLLGSCPLSRDQPPLGDPWASVGGELEYSPPAAMHDRTRESIAANQDRARLRQSRRFTRRQKGKEAPILSSTTRQE